MFSRKKSKDQVKDKEMAKEISESGGTPPVPSNSNSTPITNNNPFPPPHPFPINNNSTPINNNRTFPPPRPFPGAPQQILPNLPHMPPGMQQQRPGFPNMPQHNFPGMQQPGFPNMPYTNFGNNARPFPGRPPFNLPPPPSSLPPTPPTPTTTSATSSARPSTDDGELQRTVDILNEEKEFHKAKVEKAYAKGVDIMTKAQTDYTEESSIYSKVKEGLKTVSESIDDKLLDTITGNPIVQNAIHIADQLVDIGKTLPFIAPAFTILKIIIDTEKKAREADAKCDDLLERINFMLSHLTVLNKVQVMESTKHVIEKMNSVLKDSASLIQAYRKQGAIARRLNTTNKDKFVTCVTKINTCSNDLMISLQIQQTGQLDILTRSVPVDPEDEAAQIFLNKHGGADAVKNNRELVGQFAKQVHVKMDDTVMEQLNANITDLMQQNQAQLDQLLKENIGAAFADSIKNLAAQLNESEKEQKFQCVQCNQEYRNSINGPASCSFHRAPYDSWSKSNPCCGQSPNCQFRSHRAKHHCEYPYGTFFEHSRGILGYTDTIDEWADVKEVNLEDGKEQKALMGRLLRWASKGGYLDKPIILITVGAVWYTQSYYFETFTAEELQEISKNVAMTRKTLIFRTSTSESEYAMAEWVLSAEDTITGIKLTVKVATSEDASVQLCPIDIASGTKSGDTQTLSEGGFKVFKPASSYQLPEMVRVGPELSEKPVRAVRNDFKTRTTAALPVVLKATSDPPLHANELARSDADNFDGIVSIFNKHPAGSMNPITIASISVTYRLVGEKVYTPVSSFKLLDAQLPITVDPRQSTQLKYQIQVPRTDEDIKRDVKWWNRAFMARKRPLRVKITIQDIEGEECSLVVEYVFKPYSLEKLKEDDLAFFYFDDPELCTRNSIRVSKSSNVVSVGGRDMDVEQLHKIVYKARKSGETEIDLEFGQEKDYGLWEWKAWALVDLSCQRVYAFKVFLTEGKLVEHKTMGCFGYVLCPEYGEPKETRPIQYAQEKVELPKLEPRTEEEYVYEDDLDDYVPEPEKPKVTPTVAAAGGVVGSQMVISEDLERRLASMESSLSRIALAVEKLVDIFGKMGEAVVEDPVVL